MFDYYSNITGKLKSTNMNPEVCKLPKDSGFGRAMLLSFYFDANAGQCKEFSYGGNGGNENNFVTKQECEQTCGGIS